VELTIHFHLFQIETRCITYLPSIHGVHSALPQVQGLRFLLHIVNRGSYWTYCYDVCLLEVPSESAEAIS
jgi:hypothetical protein